MREIINKDELEYILSLDEDKITKSIIMELFGNFNGKSKYSPSDIITIPKDSYGIEGKKNKNQFKTTIGLWVFNRLFIERHFTHVLGYINTTIDNKTYKSINKKLSYALLEDKIKTDEYSDFLQKSQWMMRFVSVLSPNQTEKMLLTNEALKAKKKELFTKYKKELDEGDVVVADMVEKELIKAAKEYLKDDDSMDIYNSGARSKFDNSFKNAYLMRGTVATRDPKKPFKIVKGDYTSGISKEDFHIMADTPAVDAAYSSAKDTADGGYKSKLYRRAFQHVHLGPKDSDCGTKGYIEVLMTDKMLDGFMYSYIIESGNTLVELTSENRDKYKDKLVKLRFSSMCKMENGMKCNKCMGNLYYRQGISNVGFLATAISNKLMNLNLKKKHVSQVKLVKPNIMKIFSIK